MTRDPLPAMHTSLLAAGYRSLTTDDFLGPSPFNEQTSSASHLAKGGPPGADAQLRSSRSFSIHRRLSAANKELSQPQDLKGGATERNLPHALASLPMAILLIESYPAYCESVFRLPATVNAVNTKMAWTTAWLGLLHSLH